MGLLELEISDLQDLGRKIIKDEISLDKAKAMIGVYNQTAKRENMLIQLAIAGDKYGKDRSWKKLNQMNFMDEKGVIESRSPELESMCKCQEMGDKLISREECLDFSGDAKHIDDCQECPQFSITRKQIRP